tara:strand:- start:3508 stop:4488 length:981 start_codon:yes stop_codon:yes gene_type:complete
MAFLDNSGDILLDVVLTSEGRKRLAAGTFRATKYAFGDQEINYGLYDATNTSGSAYYDLTILQTPIEIAHTDASISLQTKLFTLTSVDGDPQILYLPQLKLDNGITDAASALASGRNAFAVVADDATYSALVTAGSNSLPTGFIDGRTAELAGLGARVRTPLGIIDAISNNPQQDPYVPLDPSLDESRYNVTLDNRFLALVQPGNPADGSNASIVSSAATSNLFSGDSYLRVYPVSKAGNSTLFVQGANVKQVSAFQGPSTTRVLASTFVVNPTNQDNIFSTYKVGNVANYASTGVEMEVIQTSVKVATFAYGYTITVPLEVIRKV